MNNGTVGEQYAERFGFNALGWAMFRTQPPTKRVFRNGKLTIEIGVETMAFAAQRLYDEQAFNASDGEKEAEADFYVADADEFARSVVRRLEREAEDGTNAIHLLLDTAFNEVAERGEDGLAEREKSSESDL